jgi:predicted MFS family arabinose efflux permease
MLAGALAGGLLLRLVNVAAPLWLAAALLAACSVIAYAASRLPQAESWR